MILQRDVRLLTPINKYGCYYCAIAFLANKYTNCPLGVDDLNDGYEDCVSAGYMSADCFVDKPGQIFHYFGLSVYYHNRYDSPSCICKDGEVEILFFEYERPNKPAWPHFVSGDGAGHVAYDPWGVSTVVRLGQLRSKRIFTI